MSTGGDGKDDWARENAQDGAEARDTAIAQVGEATPDWQAQALAAIRQIAASQATLTTDDVWRALGRDHDLEGRAMGAAILTAARLGLVARTNYTEKSLRVVCHRRNRSVGVR
jgi:hypothetical protein